MKKRFLGLLSAVLCLSLLLVGCGKTNWGVTLLEAQSLPYDSYYQVQAVIQTVSNDHFSGAVKQLLKDRWAEYLTDRSTFTGFPGSYRYAFDTWGEAGAWLGITPDNPLDAVDWLKPRALYTNPDKACPYQASIYGDEDGSVQYAWLDAVYWAGEAKLSLSVMIYTPAHEEAADNIIETGLYSAEETPMEVSADTYMIADGKEALLVISQRGGDSVSISAYFVRDGLLYDIHVSAAEEEAYQLIARALDEF